LVQVFGGVIDSVDGARSALPPKAVLANGKVGYAARASFGTLTVARAPSRQEEICHSRGIPRVRAQRPE
jgi:hypothetical protein